MKKWLKRIALILAGLIGLVVVLIVGVLLTGRSRFNRTFAIEAQPLTVAHDDDALARGQHLVEAVAHCGYCHGDDLGGKIVVDNPGQIGVIVAPNLTAGAGGRGAVYDDADWVLALHHGVNHDGRSVLIMPSLLFTHIGASDLAAIIAYVQSVPPVDNDLPPTAPGVMAYALLGAGPLLGAMSAYQIDHEAPLAETPAEAPTAEYGAYLVNIAQCRGCHGPELAGGQVARNSPIGPNLTPGGELADWSEADFITTLRTGVDPDGDQIDTFMPWQYFTHMTDTELAAIWAYLQTQPAREDALPPAAE